MEDKERAIRELHERIEELAKRQKSFQEEIQKLQNEIFVLDLGERPARVTPAEVQKPIATTPVTVVAKEIPKQVEKPVEIARAHITVAAPPKAKKERTPIEEFIGTNLLNKIGIAILVIGIGFGVKYSIDHELIQPLTRIILGYLSGAVLVALALRMKKKHESFSAVLLSGGLAVFYFITFAAYDFYDLIPQTVAFGLMVAFTAFAVFAAIQYNMEVIGIIGLVGAYAVPFLLSDGSGRVLILFSYITVINSGIVILAFKKYWKRLYYLGFALTWLSFSAWWFDQYRADEHLAISLAFATIFFVTFYITFLSYKLIRKEPLSKVDLFFMLLNSFVFYGFGYLSIEDASGGDEWLGLFTIATAVLHFIACMIVFRQQSQFRDTFYFVAGMVLVFITLAVPVQLDGNWVTLVWAFEALLLFWIGRTKSFPTYEKLSYPLIVLAAGSLFHDWSDYYANPAYFSPEEMINVPLFVNIQFATTILVTISLGLLLIVSMRPAYKFPFEDRHVANLFQYGLGVLVVLILYAGIFVEVQHYWDQRYYGDVVRVRSEYEDYYSQYNNDLLQLKTLWLIYFSAMFMLALSFVRSKFIKNEYLTAVNVVLNALVVASFLMGGLFALGLLRGSYLNQQTDPYFEHNIGNILVRYLGVALMIPLVLINIRSMKSSVFTEQLRVGERVLLHLAILILLSSELVHWLEMARIENSFKLALSILWGSYALFLIVLGLWKDKKYIRVSAMVLFAVTLTKLFLYDMADMSTIAKTIVMVILGILMLVASFLYNKYKKVPQNEIQ